MKRCSSKDLTLQDKCINICPDIVIKASIGDDTSTPCLNATAEFGEFPAKIWPVKPLTAEKI